MKASQKLVTFLLACAAGLLYHSSAFCQAPPIAALFDFRCEDGLNLSKNEVDNPNPDVDRFESSFKFGANYTTWGHKSEDIPISELVTLWNNLPKPTCHSNYVTALKIWRGATEEGDLVMLYQPMVMRWNSRSEHNTGCNGDDCSHAQDYKECAYTVEETNMQPYLRLIGGRLQAESLAATLIDNYTRLAKRLKWDYTDANDFTEILNTDEVISDTRFAIFPFQEIGMVADLAQANAASSVTVTNVAGNFWSKSFGRRNVFQKNWRVKHHYILSVSVPGNVPQIVKEATTTVKKNANLAGLCPPNCPNNDIIYILQH